MHATNQERLERQQNRRQKFFDERKEEEDKSIHLTQPRMNKDDADTAVQGFFDRLEQDQQRRERDKLKRREEKEEKLKAQLKEMEMAKAAANRRRPVSKGAEAETRRRLKTSKPGYDLYWQAGIRDRRQSERRRERAEKELRQQQASSVHRDVISDGNVFRRLFPHEDEMGVSGAANQIPAKDLPDISSKSVGGSALAAEEMPVAISRDRTLRIEPDAPWDPASETINRNVARMQVASVKGPQQESQQPHRHLDAAALSGTQLTQRDVINRKWAEIEKERSR
jgi:hypothetical protein